jgi:hypothetical protein
MREHFGIIMAWLSGWTFGITFVYAIQRAGWESVGLGLFGGATMLAIAVLERHTQSRRRRPQGGEV